MAYVYTILMLLLIVIGHEAAHAFTGIALGYKPKLVAIGIPIEHTFRGHKLTTVVWRKTHNGVEYMISILLLGGGVDFHDYESPPFWDVFLIVMAGPMFNFVAGFLGIVLFLGWAPAVGMFMEIFDATLLAIGMVTTGAVPAIQLTKMGTMVVVLADNVATLRTADFLFNWLLLNISLGLCNLFPLPAIDGGQIVMAAIVGVLGEKYRKPSKKISYAFFLLIFSFILMGFGLDIWTLVF